MSRAVTSIKRGLEQAIAHQEGRPVKIRVHRIPDIDVKTVREKTGLTQLEFATKFAISPGTLRHWERGDRRPRGTSRVLLSYHRSRAEDSLACARAEWNTGWKVGQTRFSAGERRLRLEWSVSSNGMFGRPVDAPAILKSYAARERLAAPESEWNSRRSPGWQPSTSQIASSVEKRIARALPVLRIDRLASLISIRSASSVRVIRPSAFTTFPRTRASRPDSS